MRILSVVGFALGAVFALAGPVHAQERVDSDSGADMVLDTDSGVHKVGKPLPNEKLIDLKEKFDAVFAHQIELERIETRLEKSEGLVKRVLQARTDRYRLDVLKEALRATKMLADLGDDGFDISAYYDGALQMLSYLPDALHKAIRRNSHEVTSITAKPLDAPEQAAVDAKLEEMSLSSDEMIKALIDALELMKTYGLDDAKEKKRLKGDLADSAEQRSVFLELAIDDLSLLRARSQALPKDQELLAKVRVMANRVNIAAEALKRSVNFMLALDMPAVDYESQVIQATGQITTDILDTEVIETIWERWLESIVTWVEDSGFKLVFKLIIFFIIVLAFWALSRLVTITVRGALKSKRVDISTLATRMIVSWTKNLVLLIALLIALSQMGISIGPLLAGIGVAGVILGFALQDVLSNFASGLMIVIYRPFDVGDILETGDTFGTVNRMSLVNTTILTFDNRTLVFPNNMIWRNVINNVTAQKVRRVDLVFGISYSDDIAKTEKVLHEVVTSCDKVLKQPEPKIRVHELGDSSVNFIVWPWVKTENYWEVYWELTREVKLALDKNQITIPFPQRDVHFFQGNTSNGLVNEED